MSRTWQICRILIWTGTLETLRRKDLYVVLILSALMIAGAWSFSFFGVRGLEIFLKDVMLTVIGLLSTILAVLISGRQLPEEMQRRTIYPLMARPISRRQLLLGKWMTAVSVSWICFMTLALVGFTLLLLFGIRLEPIFGQYLILKSFGLAWLCAMTVALSVYVTPSANVTLCLILAFGSGLFNRMLLMLHAEEGLASPLLNILYGFFPHYDFFDLGKKVTYDWALIPWWVIGLLAVYALLSGAFWLFIGWIRFRKQVI
jgi:ABC-type transport system involved in multi-copper enzyme maturation permease subunit